MGASVYYDPRILLIRLACRREREFNFNSDRIGLSATIISPTFFYICQNWLRNGDRFLCTLSDLDENFYSAKLEEI